MHRSATGAGAPAAEIRTAGVAAGAAPATRAVAHSPQKRMPGGLPVPHDGQIAVSGAAQPPQNFRPASFAVPQLGQIKASRSSLAR